MNFIRLFFLVATKFEFNQDSHAGEISIALRKFRVAALCVQLHARALESDSA